MSEAATTPAEETESATDAAPDFSPVEIQNFVEDDATAGRALGKMLAIFFLYTVFVTGLLATYLTSVFR